LYNWRVSFLYSSGKVGRNFDMICLQKVLVFSNRCLESRNLASKSFDKHGVGIPIDDRFVLDVSSATSVLDCAGRFVVVGVSW